jgi:hypothetical protein
MTPIQLTRRCLKSDVPRGWRRALVQLPDGSPLSSPASGAKQQTVQSYAGRGTRSAQTVATQVLPPSPPQESWQPPSAI